MKSALLGLIAATSMLGCATPPDRTGSPDAGASIAPTGSTEPPDAGPGDDGEDETSRAIAFFAATHGGLHGSPVELAFRWPKLAAPSFVFFVGGDAAQAAWIATRTTCPNSTERRASDPCPRDPATSVMQNGHVFEWVAEWPRAVRVVSVVPIAKADAGQFNNLAAVVVESLAARDQPAGLRGVLVLTDTGNLWASAGERGQWQWAGVTSVAELGPLVAQPPPDFPSEQFGAILSRFGRASKSPAALAAEIGPGGLDVFEIWQRTLVRRAEHLEAASVSLSPRLDRIRDVFARASDEQTVCLDAVCEIGSRSGEGISLASDAGKASFRAVFLDGPRTIRASTETTPVAAAGDALLETLRFATPALVSPRVVTQADLGGGRRVGVVENDGVTYIVERDGAYSLVQRVTGAYGVAGDRSEPCPLPGFTPCARDSIGAHLDARVVDLDGDATADVLLFDTTTASVPRAFAFLRSLRIEHPPHRTELGVEVAMVGATSLDDAVRLARSPAAPVNATRAEVCALASRASTARGFLSVAAPGARVVFFGTSEQPAFATRIIDAADVRDAHVARLHGICDSLKVNNGGISWRKPGQEPAHQAFCSANLCADFEWPTIGEVRDYLRVVRIDGALKIDTAFVEDRSPPK